MAETALLLIDPDPRSAAFVQSALRQAGYEVEVASSGKEGLIAALRDQPDIVVLELALPDLDGEELVRRLRADPRTQRKLLVGLTARSSPEETIAAREAGLDYYLLKQPDALDLLLSTLAPHRHRGSAPVSTAPLQTGQLIAFASARGGIGASTIALNVAHEAALALPSESVAVLDLVLPLGSLTALAGFQADLDLLDLINLDAGERTPTELRKRTRGVAGWKVFLIPGARDPRRAAQLRSERVGPLLQALRATFDLTFVDLGRSLSRLAFLLFSQADLVVFLVGPDEPTVENGRRILTFLREEGLPEERILVVSNRPTGGEPMPGEELERRLGRAADLALPYSGSNFALASSLHAPFSLRFPEENATKVLRDIAGRVIEKLRVPTE